ncbi:S8 family serine peptidase [Micromonospora sp. NPDC050397]|uniref:S8 family serine peptidase n=1 Tax=Micromonospora sp. NPDC050397 TaxID=3364279 RepID=UPI00384CD4B4
MALRPRGIRLAALISTLLAVTGATPATAAARSSPDPGTGSATGAPAGASPVSTPPGTHTVTLITGDVVTTRQNGTGAGGTVQVRRPDGTPSRARIVESGDSLYVYPEAVLPFVAAKTLDRRLFDITSLVADGYDDAHTATLPLIVEYTDAGQGLRGAATPPGAVRSRALTSIQGAAVSTERGRAADFWAAVTSSSSDPSTRSKSTQDGTPSFGAGIGKNGTPSFGAGIEKIWLDGRVFPDLAESTAQIGAPEVWAGGDTGEGVRVAVLDTGIDASHPDLTDRIAESAVFVPDEEIVDRRGHGTHVASTIAGTGAASGGREKGVAPGAQLAVGKVLSDQGYGLDSWVLAGMEWAARDADAAIVNMSLGSDQPSDGSDPISQAVNSLSAETGALFVVAAGNFGAPSTVSAPGAADAALTVGAVDGNDELAYFSSQGPRLADEALKPELTAPGVAILAAHSRYAAGDEGYYQTMDGTSMATPHVAGAAALLAAEHPGWTGQQLKDALVSTTKATPRYDAYQGGTGRLDVAAAVRAPIVATGTAYTGVALDPRPATANRATSMAAGPVSRPVTYTNTTGQPITLDLALDAASAPTGLFALSTNRVTVPGNGTATVTLTVDPSRASPGARYTGQVVASGAGTVLARTAIGVGTVTPYHRLTLRLTGRDGQPLGGFVELMRSGSFGPDFVWVDGETSMLLPEDVYSAMSFVDVPGSHGTNSLGLALIGDPDIDLRRDTTVALDASKVRQVQSTVPRSTGDTYARLDYHRTMGGGLWRSFVDAGVYYDSFWAVPSSDKVTHGDFYLSARWRKEQPVLSVASSRDDFDDLVRQQGTTQLPKGRWDLTAVYAGNGAAADYAKVDARGKIAVVRRNDDVTDRAQAAAATSAGAKLLLVVSDQPWRDVRNYGVDFFTPTPIEVALLSKDAGLALVDQIRRGPTKLTVTSQPAADYLYDLVQTHHNTIPRELTRRETERTLARIDVNFNLPAGATRGGEFRFDWPSYNDWGIGLTSNRPLAPVRTDWVSTGELYKWGQEAYVEGGTYQIDERISYQPGSLGHERFFTPIERPYLNNNFRPPFRNGQTFNLDIPGAGGDDHVGMVLNASAQTNTLYQGGTQLGQGTGTRVTGTAPSAKTLPYRLNVKTSQDPTAGPYSTRTETDWTFRSKAPTGEGNAVLPLLQLDYKVDTDAAGTTKAKTELTLAAAHLPDATDCGRIDSVGLDISYDDGAHWQRQSLDRAKDGQWKANLRAPKGARFVSIRATARDTTGNSVTQTITRAFGLR